MVILSRDYSCGMFTGPSWNHYSDFKPKKYNSWSNTFEVRYNYYAPGWKVSRLARRNGWRAALREDDVCPIKQLQNIMHPIGEMLVKNKQYRIFNHWTRRGENDMDDYLPSLRICNRNRYVISDASMWLDYIDLLVYFHKDIHNAHYVCPEDLKMEHDRLMMKKQRIEEEQAKRDAVKKAKNKELAYRKLHGAYFGVCFGNDEIVVSVISSVEEMAIEGLLMHHCVYQNGYYKRPDSLILSAKDTKGNRLETIEVNLRTWSIVQSRGKFNNPTDRHAEIIDLVNKNMNKLRKFA